MNESDPPVQKPDAFRGLVMLLMMGEVLEFERKRHDEEHTRGCRRP